VADAAVTSPHATFELVIGGMTCAACAARVQGKLNKLEGVTATVNFATGRARVTAPPGATAPDLIRVVAAAGYTAELPAPAAAGPASATDDQAADRSAAADDAAVRRLRGRLILALIFFVPLTDASIVLSLFPWARFPGWQWCLVALALPVATWAAWPFHQAALKNARHQSAAAGDTVTGGTIVLTGRLVVRADQVGPHTQLAHLITMVEQAQAGRAGVQRLADRICAVFVPCVLACSALTLAGWLLAGGPAERAFSAALAVLIIACPCALGLATPAALVAASGRGAQLGIFIKGYQALEASQAIDTVVLDKTGTVTTGRMTVTGVQPVPGTGRQDLLRYAGSVEQASEHAVAAAVTAMARAEAAPLADADGFAALAGLGARGDVDGHAVTVGREQLFAGQGTAVPADLALWCRTQEQAGCTTILVSWDGLIRGALAVTDTVKPSAAAAVTGLRRLGLSPVLLTGDNAATAEAVAAAAGITEVISGALPAAKAQVINGLQAAGRPAAMVGDGVNDAPALAAAQLGPRLRHRRGHLRRRHDPAP
jgi:cation transport ATPase